jgi:hypothetical protein
VFHARTFRRETILYITRLDCKSKSWFGIENISIQNQQFRKRFQMINLKTDTLYSWRYDADGTALNIPSEGAFNVFGGDPIAAFNHLINQVYQSPIVTLRGDHLNTDLEVFRPDNADGFYGTSDIFQDYRFSGSPDNDYILGCGDAFRANTGNGNDVVVFGYVTDAVDDPLVGGATV